MIKGNAALNVDIGRLNSQEDLNTLRQQIIDNQNPDQMEVVVCHGTGCLANGSQQVTNAFKEALKSSGIDAKVIPGIKTTGCQGFCSRGPLVLIKPEGLFYQKVKPKDVEEIVNETIINGKHIERLLYKDPKTGKTIHIEQEIPFYNLLYRYNEAPNCSLLLPPTFCLNR